MKLSLTNGETLVAPLPAQLLAITPTQLSDGSAKPILIGINAQLSMARWDFVLAQWTAKWAQIELKEASAASPTPIATPVVTFTPAPTAP
jgi:hypothetical protein